MRFPKIIPACILYFGFLFPLQAQQKHFTLTEAVSGLSSTLATEKVRMPSWQPGTEAFFQVVSGEDKKDCLIRTLYPQGITDTVARLTQLNEHFFNNHPLKSFPPVTWIDKDYVFFRKENKLYKGALTGNGFYWTAWADLPEKAENLTVDRHMQIAYTIDQNLWMIRHNGSPVAVTEETDPHILSGQSVHRNEFGIDRGIFFSPKGNLLAYYHMDQRKVKDYPVMQWDQIPATVHTVKYPMAGGVSHEVTVRIFNPVTGRTVTMETGMPKDQYLTSVSWSPDEQYLFIALLNRAQDHLQLNKYDAVTGKKVATLFEETDPCYVEPQYPLTFLPGSSREFIWWSERDGFMHLYLYDTDGRLIRQLTKGKYEVNELIGFCKEKQEVIITAAKESPLEKHIYAVNWKSGKIKRLDQEPGTHQPLLSESGRWMYDRYTADTIPGVSLIRNIKTGEKITLLRSADPLAAYKRASVQQVTLYAGDGTPLYGRLILPPDLDPTRKYPVVVYLYNGPHAQLIKNTFPGSGNLWYEYMAQRGYVIFTMDGRGSSNRGQAFEQAIFRQLGTVEMEDQLKGVDYLKSLPYIDTARLGVHGWSYGGFMTVSLMLRHPGVFKAGVAGGPVIDWRMYEVMYTERYMDTPEENPEGYATASLLDKVGNLEGKLLLIHGTTDDVVVWQHSVRLLQQFVMAGIQVDYFIYPGHPHNVRGKDRVHLMQKITDYFDQNL